MQHLFTPEEANKKLPEARRLVSEIVTVKKKLDEPTLTESQSVALVDKFTASVSKLEELGIELKDVDIGLIDFPAKRFDEEVYLCWKLGEPEILYWHGLKEGFRGRKHIKPKLTSVL